MGKPLAQFSPINYTKQINKTILIIKEKKRKAKDVIAYNRNNTRQTNLSFYKSYTRMSKFAISRQGKGNKKKEEILNHRKTLVYKEIQ